MPQQSLLTRGIKFTPLLVILWATVWVVAPRWGAATIKRPRSTYDVRWRVVGGARTTHRFFDSSAISPSGRYVCATRTRREGPADVTPGDVAEVVVYDLQKKREDRFPVVYRRPTAAWDAQLGAQVQWGASDGEIYFNDVVGTRSDGAPIVRGVRSDWQRGRETRLPTPVYHVTRDGARAAAPRDLAALRMTQDGYGVVVTPEQLRHLESQKDGVHVLDLRTNATAFLELSALVAAAELEERPRAVAGGDARRGAECHRHVFHVKWNAKGTRLLVVVRARGHGCPRGDANHALTVNPDGADVKVVATWLRDGNHPNWLEDGRLSMNYEGKVCAFDDVEGASCQVLSERASGHPVGVPGRGDLVVTDTYAKEHAAFGLEAGEAALRVLSGGDREAWLGVFPVAALGTMPTDVWRCDAHPAFDVKGRRLALNVWVRGSRRVAVTDEIDWDALLKRRDLWFS